MKNDLTAEEWKTLSEYLNVEHVIIHWIDERTIGKKVDLLESAKEKIQKIAKDL